MATDVYQAIQPPEPVAMPSTAGHTSSGWSLAFYVAVTLAVLLASFRAVWPPAEARLDPSITQVQ